MTPSKSSDKRLQDGALFWIATGLGVLAIGALIWWVDLEWLHHQVERLNGFAVFALLVLLPLVGIPVSVLFVVSGAKFGHAWGLALTAVAIALHLLASWWIAHSWLKRPLEAGLRKLKRRKPQVPHGEYVPVCLVVALMPGVSYALKNYLLVLAGVPFRQFFWTLLPAHLIHASLAILFGDFTGSMTTPKIIFLVVYAIAVIGLSHRVFRRMKERTQSAGHSSPEDKTPQDVAS
jgi:uncharacterized membrane protein YdjX (TVP38/TMEM64 family)